MPISNINLASRKWTSVRLHDRANLWIVDQTNAPQPEYVVAKLVAVDHQSASASLISTSPELLAVLSDILDRIPEARTDRAIAVYRKAIGNL